MTISPGGRSAPAFANFTLLEMAVNGDTCDEKFADFNRRSENAAAGINPQSRLNSGDRSKVAKGE